MTETIDEVPDDVFNPYDPDAPNLLVEYDKPRGSLQVSNGYVGMSLDSCTYYDTLSELKVPPPQQLAKHLIRLVDWA